MEHRIRPEAIELPPTQPIDITEWLHQAVQEDHLIG